VWWWEICSPRVFETFLQSTMPQKKKHNGRGRPKKRGVLKLDARRARGSRIDLVKFGIIVGHVLAADSGGSTLNLSKLGRLPSVRAHASTVSRIAKRVRSGEDMDGPPTQAHKDPRLAQLVSTRRVCAERAALKSTPRAAHPTLEAIRMSLPVAKRPRCCSTVWIKSPWGVEVEHRHVPLVGASVDAVQGGVRQGCVE
jgi:hypothetical protein